MPCSHLIAGTCSSEVRDKCFGERRTGCTDRGIIGSMLWIGRVPSKKVDRIRRL